MFQTAGMGMQNDIDKAFFSQVYSAVLTVLTIAKYKSFQLNLLVRIRFCFVKTNYMCAKLLKIFIQHLYNNNTAKQC